MVKNLPALWEPHIWSPGWEDPLEERISSLAAYLENPMGKKLQSMGLKELDTTERPTLSLSRTCVYI